MNGKSNINPKVTSDQYACNSDVDCQATCSFGCVNTKWMIGRADCEMFVDITCTCFQGQCIDKGLEPESQPTDSGE